MSSIRPSSPESGSPLNSSTDDVKEENSQSAPSEELLMSNEEAETLYEVENPTSKERANNVS